MKISLALSGGGFRATVFHLGVLARLARSNKMEQVELLSTVSGGSLCAGLVFSLNNCQWPDSKTFLEKVEPEAHQLMTTFDLQGSLIQRAFGTFWTLLETRASALSGLMQKHWKMTANLLDLPEKPRWMINTTCYETGKNWRFERLRMGDYVFGYSNTTGIRLSDAVAASAGFPGLIGALAFETGGRKWFKYVEQPTASQLSTNAQEDPNWVKVEIQPKYETVHLWDGGVYDNHGLEGIYDFGKGWSERFGFLIVSDAAGTAGEERYRKGIAALMRLSSGIMMNQVRSLRTRAMVARLVEHPEIDQGVFLQMGNTYKGILKSARREDLLPKDGHGVLADGEAEIAARMATKISKLPEEEYERMFHHGYEVADATLSAYYPADYQPVAYQR
ncbi:MAG: patatin-like phospholipase family protein [Chloroflexi bacterium]|nr:MAG: patatin-like phospholipase family protein [Chloroflexota bacterium]